VAGNSGLSQRSAIEEVIVIEETEFPSGFRGRYDAPHVHNITIILHDYNIL